MSTFWVFLTPLRGGPNVFTLARVLLRYLHRWIQMRLWLPSGLLAVQGPGTTSHSTMNLRRARGCDTGTLMTLVSSPWTGACTWPVRSNTIVPAEGPGPVGPGRVEAPEAEGVTNESSVRAALNTGANAKNAWLHVTCARASAIDGAPRVWNVSAKFRSASGGTATRAVLPICVPSARKKSRSQAAAWFARFTTARSVYDPDVSRNSPCRFAAAPAGSALSDEITGTSVLALPLAMRACTSTCVPASISISPNAPGVASPTNLLVRRGWTVPLVLGVGRWVPFVFAGRKSAPKRRSWV